MRVAGHQSAVGVLGHTEPVTGLTVLLTHVVVLCLGNHLPIVNTFLVFSRVRLVQLVDYNVTGQSFRALTEFPSDLRLAA